MLTTLINVRRALELKDTDTSLDSIIEDQIAAVSAQVSEYCGRDFEQKDFIEYFDGGAYQLFLSNLPVQEILGVWVDDDWEWGDDKKLGEDEYLLVNPETGIVAYKNGWSFSGGGVPNEVKVWYNAGYPVPPDDLEMAVRTQVAYNVKRRKDLGLTSVTYPDGSIQKQLLNEFLPGVKEILDRKTKVRV